MHVYMRALILLVCACDSYRGGVRRAWHGDARALELVDRQNVLASLLFALPSLASVRQSPRLAVGSPLSISTAKPSNGGQIAVNGKFAPQSLRRPYQTQHSRAGGVLASVEDKVQKFHKWLESNGMSTTAVKGGQVPGYGFGLISEGVSAGEQVLAVPASLHISYAAVSKSPLGMAVVPTVSPEDETAFLALGLLAEVAKGEDSALAPYIDILPSADDMDGLPLLWEEDDLAKYLAGSHLRTYVQQTRNQILQQWAAIEKDVLPKHPENLFPRTTFNALGYLWAHAICSTRALPFGNDLSLIPYLDIANHKSGSPNKCSIGVFDESSSASNAVKVVTPTDEVELEGKESFAVITASEDLPKGTQVFIDYGEGYRSSWEMLYTYGFVPGTTQTEWLANGGRPMFFEGLRKDDPYFMQKHAVLATLGLDDSAMEGSWVDLKADTKVSVAMAPLIRLAHLSPDNTGMSPEVVDLAKKLAEWSAPPKEMWMALQKPLDQATENLVAKKILSQCEEAIAEIPPVEELLESASIDAASGQLHRKLGAQVLLGERHALEACMLEWQSHLVEVGE